MVQASRPPVWGYGVAVAAVTLASLLNLPLANLVGTEVPFLLLTVAVAIGAWYGGLGPGLLATVLGAVACDYFFLPPSNSPSITGVGTAIRLAACVATGVLISGLFEALHAARRRADEGEGRYRSMVENVRDHAIFTTDPEGIVTSWNEGAERLLGHAEGEIVGKPASILFTPEDIQDGVPERELETARAEGRAEDTRWHVTKGGRRFFAMGSVNAMRDAAGDLRGFIKVMRDITHRRRAEEERAALLARESEARQQAEAARAEAEAVGRAKDRFLAMLSHELRTPLTPVLLTTTAMLDDPKTPAELRPTLEMFCQNVGLEARLIDDLLDVMRTISGKMPYRWEVVDAHDLIRKTLEIVRGDALAKRIRLDAELAANESHVHADPTRLTQALWNLVKNAVKFSPEGSTITIRSRDEGGRLVVEVIDRGIGIEPHALGRIFNAFEQAEDAITRRFGGLGLGLAISRSIVEAHGGNLTATSLGRDRGATFTLALATVSPTGVEGAIEPLPSGIPEHRDCKILLVEDDAVSSRIMAMLLREVGHDVTAAVSFAQAMEAVSADFDLVVSDIGLPDGSGLDLMRRIRDEYGVCGIALTGYGMDEDIVKSREAGFRAHLTKPIDFPSLVKTIQRVTSMAEC